MNITKVLWGSIVIAQLTCITTQAALYQLDNGNISTVLNASDGTEPRDNWFGNVFNAQPGANVITRVDFGLFTTTPNSTAKVVLYRVTDSGGNPAVGATRVYTQDFTPMVGDGTNAFIQQVNLTTPVSFSVGDLFLVSVFIPNVIAAPPNDVYPFLLDTSGSPVRTYWDRSDPNMFDLDNLSAARPISVPFVQGGFTPGPGHIIIRAFGEPGGALSVTKACASPIVTNIGSSITVTGQVCNIGGIDVTNVVIVDAAPGLPVLATNIIDLLPAGACSNYSFTYTSTTCDPNHDTVSVTATDLLGAQIGPVSASADCYLCCPAVSLTSLVGLMLPGDICSGNLSSYGPTATGGTGNTGDPSVDNARFCYAIVVRNIGHDPLTNIVILDDTLGALGTFPGPLAVGGTITISNLRTNWAQTTTNTTVVTAQCGGIHGNGAVTSASGSSVAIVVPPPTINCPSNITVECTGGLTPVTYSVTAFDYNSNALPVTCTPPSGTGFPSGVSNVVCSTIDSFGGSNSCSFTVTVADTTPPQVTCPSNIVVQAPNCTGSVVTFIATASDACGLSSFSCSPPSGSTFPIGVTTVVCTASDMSGHTNAGSFTVTVCPPVPPTIANVSVDKASLWPPNHKMQDVMVNYRVVDACTNQPSCTLSVTSNEPENGTGDGDTSPDWEVVDAHHVRLRAERAAKGNGRIYTIAITCADLCGSSTTNTVTVVVAHNITAPVSGTAFKINTSVGFAGTFWDIPGNRHTAWWQFDNLTTSGSVTEPSGLKNGVVKGSYKFGTPGVYKTTMFVKDQKGVTSWVNTAGDVESIVVIYDPNGGYTIGGGWIHSPAGAFAADPAATGKLSFGFSSQYFKGAANPKGEMLVKFLDANFEFSALNFEYLVIAGAKAQFKGFGKINGVAGYQFLLTVIDGALAGDGVDKFRIKIWEKATGVILYDNEPGLSDADDPDTAVGDASTVIIKK